MGKQENEGSLYENAKYRIHERDLSPALVERCDVQADLQPWGPTSMLCILAK